MLLRRHSLPNCRPTIPSTKHLVKLDITNMKDILSRAQKYVQLEEATRGSTTRPPKQESEGEKTKPHSAPKKIQNWGQHNFKKRDLNWVLPGTPLRSTELDTDFTLFKTSIDRIFSAIQNQSWLRYPKPLSPNSKGSGGDYSAFHNGMGQRTIDCRHLQKHLQELVNQGYLREFILNPEKPSEVKVQKEALKAQ